MTRRKKPVRRKKPAAFVPKADLFDIPRTVAEARAIAREIGAPLDARRYESITAADEQSRIFLERQHRPRKPRARTFVPLTRRERKQTAEERRVTKEQLTYQRLRALTDSIDAGASPGTIVKLARDWNLSPDLWWTRAQNAWADVDDWEDITAHSVYAAWNDSPPGTALPEA